MTATEVSRNEVVDRFISITKIRGGSGDEMAVAEKIIELLVDEGLDRSQCQFDGAETRTRLSGNCGNLIVTLPGSGSGRRTMLSAHMDTVPICLGAEPIVEGGRRSSVVLTAAIERLRRGDENFPPAVVAFFVQEEIGLEGARHLDVSKIGEVDRAFNFDGGTVEKVTTGATGGERIEIVLTGIPAHAGVAPETGASAIVMASRAIADLDARGWLGKIEQEGSEGTANVGVIEGGQATNVVTSELKLRAEARSHDPEMRSRIVAEMRTAFEKAAAEVTNDAGKAGSCEFHSHVDYESFQLPDDHPSIQAAIEALTKIGRSPFTQRANGGLDANWLFRHGIAAVTMGCGQRDIHSADEYLEIQDYLDACQVASWLITDGS